MTDVYYACDAVTCYLEILYLHAHLLIGRLIYLCAARSIDSGCRHESTAPFNPRQIRTRSVYTTHRWLLWNGSGRSIPVQERKCSIHMLQWRHKWD